MLILVSIGDIFEPVLTVIYSLILLINGLIYGIIDFAYQVFISIASAQIFSTELYQTLSQRLYVLIGVIALFFVAYALLRAIAEPDGAGKGDMSVGKIVPNLIKAIILIAFTPFIFNLAYQLQGSIIKTNVIPNIILNSDATGKITTTSGKEFSYSAAGREIANDMYSSFLIPTECNGDPQSCFDSVELADDGWKMFGAPAKNYTLKQAYDDVNGGAKDFYIYVNFAPNITNGEILTFNFLLQMIAGCFLLYVFVSFCIDMGIRAVKLGYYQIIAPIPIFTMIIPGQKKIFENWYKGAISTFLEVIIRLAIIFFGILMIESLPSVTDDIWSNSILGSPGIMVRIFARIFVILGIIMFMKQAPKLISDMFGLKSGSFKLGIGDKLRDGGVFGAAGALGAGALAVANKGAHNYANAWNSAAGKGKLAHAGALLKGTAQTLTPGSLIRYGSAGVHGYNATKDSKSVADFGTGMEQGVAQSLSAPNVFSTTAATAQDFGGNVASSVTTDYSPYNSKRELAKAGEYDKFNKHKSAVNDMITSDSRYKQISSYYDEQIANANKAGNFEAAMDLTSKKTTATIKAKNAIATEKLTGHVAHFARNNNGDLFANNIDDPAKNKAIDIKLQGELDKFASDLRDDSGLVQSSLADTHTVLKDSNGSTIDPNNINDIIKSVKNGSVGIVNNIGTSSDKSASAIRSKAMEEAAKKDTKK